MMIVLKMVGRPSTLANLRNDHKTIGELRFKVDNIIMPLT